MKAELKERLEFETLLADLSARFVNLTTSRLSAEIEDAQRSVCDHLGLDQSSLWRWEASRPDAYVMTHLYRRIDIPRVPRRMEAAEAFPWVLRQVISKTPVVVSSMADVPEEATRDLASWRHYGVKATLTLPLYAGDDPTFGALTFASLTAERAWPEPLIKRLELIAQVFAQAILRERTELEQRRSAAALRESETRLSSAVDVAELGFYEMVEWPRLSFIDARVREFLGVPPEEESCGRDQWLARVHPEDQASVLEMSRRLIEEGVERLGAEYRYQHPSRGLVWLHHVCRVMQRDGSGRGTRVLGVIRDITDRKRGEESLRQALEEVRRLRDQLQEENLYLREEVASRHGSSEVVAVSDAMRQVMELVEQVAPTDSTVLLEGETGTGKELLAATIHGLSSRRARTMVSVNCAAIPAALIESELFGREKGAYTGALSRQAGRFEIASGSTLFLDELGDMPLEVQAKLLRVLQDGRFERLGSPTPISVDVRIIAATNQDLQEAVRKGRFRQDLYYRLNVFPIRVPPLREHPEDIPPLAMALLAEFAQRMGKPVEAVSESSMEHLLRYSWPGNVRELRNVIERAMIMAKGRTLVVPALGDSRSPAESASLAMRDAEAAHIRRVLELTGGRVRGKGGAADLLQLRPTTLDSRMQRLGVNRSGK